MSLLGRIAGVSAMLLAAMAIPAGAQDDWSGVVAAAKKEATVTVYSGFPDEYMRNIATMFKAETGIDVRYQRIAGPELITRFVSEAEAGRVVADVSFVAGDAELYADQWKAKGWGQYLADAGIPVINQGLVPKKFYNGKTAPPAFYTWGIGWNTSMVKDADAPKDWKDLLNPKWKGQIVIPDPNASDAYRPFFTVLLKELGQSWFDGIRANQPRYVSGGQVAGQSLGAGEAMILLPATQTTIVGLQGSGAPVNMGVPSVTVGVENHIIMTDRAKAPHPNAARVFVNWVLSKEPNRAFNKVGGTFSIYADDVPSGYVSPVSVKSLSREEIAKLIGPR